MPPPKLIIQLTKPSLIIALVLTEKGIATAKHIVEKIDTILQYASEGLSEEHRKIMYQSLTLINNNLHKLCDGYDEENGENL